MRSIFLLLALWSSLLPGVAFASGLKAAVPFPEDKALMDATGMPTGYIPSSAPDPNVQNLKEGQLYTDSADLVANFNGALGVLNSESASTCAPQKPPCHKVYPVMALNSASGKIPVSVLTSEEANTIFKEMAAQPDIPFGYPEDGCYARAHLMAQRLEKQGIRVVKTFVEGDLRVATTKSPKGYVEWSYHVAPAIAVQDKNGKINMMVIDPSIFDHPVTVKEWTDKQTSYNKEPSKVYFTDRFRMSPIKNQKLTSSQLRSGFWGTADQSEVNETTKDALAIQNARAYGLPEPIFENFNDHSAAKKKKPEAGK